MTVDGESVSSHPRSFADVVERLVVRALSMRLTYRPALALAKPFRRWVPLRFTHRYLGRLLELGRLPMPDTVVARSPGDGGDVRFIGPADPIAAFISWKGLSGWEGEVIDVVASLLAAGDVRVFLDIGAYTGLYAILAARMSPDTQVYAFEPEPRAFRRLSENAALNHLANLELLPIAVGDHVGRATLFAPEGTLPIVASLEGAPGASPIDVQATTLDRFVASTDLADVGLIKMDIEGAEYRVMAGAQALIHRDRPTVICEVLYDRSENLLQEAIEGMDYAFFHITDKGLQPMERIVGDPEFRFLSYLFVPRERLGRLGMPR